MRTMDSGQVAWVVAAYLSGMFPTAQLVGRASGHDPLAEGSGNPGASNVYRTAGRRAGLVVLLGDMAKGLAPTAAGLIAGGRGLGLACWLAAVLGHVVPLVRGGRGGKGVATAGGGALVLFPAVSVVLVALFVLVVKRTRIAALGSLVMAGLLPVGVAVVHRRLTDVAVSVAVAVVVIARHHGNVSRLLAGTERTVRAR
jgi:glycerol-3-phosphate acyltransferase PlsY